MKLSKSLKEKPPNKMLRLIYQRKTEVEKMPINVPVKTEKMMNSLLISFSKETDIILILPQPKI